MSLPVDVEFDVVKEVWNTYKLSDETTLRTKLTLIKIARGTDASGNIGYTFNSQNHVAAFTPAKKKGKPSTRPYSPKELQSSVVDDLDFKMVKEDWNTYKLKDGTRIEIKLILTRVAKTDKFDPAGSPIYLTQTQTVIKPKISKKLRRKMVTTTKTKARDKRSTSYQV